MYTHSWAAHIYIVCIKIIGYIPSNYVIYTLPLRYIEYNCLNRRLLSIYLRSCLDLENSTCTKTRLTYHYHIETIACSDLGCI